MPSSRLRTSMPWLFSRAARLVPERISILPKIEIVPDDVLRRNRASSLNRLCNLRDWEAGRGPALTMMDLRAPVMIHRKACEYAICIDGLRQLGAIFPQARALSVGAGYETPLFYFATP